MFKKLKRAALGASVPHEKATAAMQTVKMRYRFGWYFGWQSKRSG